MWMAKVYAIKFTVDVTHWNEKKKQDYLFETLKRNGYRTFSSLAFLFKTEFDLLNLIWAAIKNRKFIAFHHDVVKRYEQETF